MAGDNMTKYTKRNPPPSGFCQLKLHILTARKSEIEIDMVADDLCRGEIMDAIARMSIRTSDKFLSVTPNAELRPTGAGLLRQVEP
jgi:hypothetical protein